MALESPVEISCVYSQQARSKKVQWMEGTHRLEEPVSNRTVNSCGGVPMLITP